MPFDVVSYVLARRILRRLEEHRSKVPIDHPDLSITRAKLEYPTENVSLAYLASINKTELFKTSYTNHLAELISDIFADKAILGWGRDGTRWQGRIDKSGNGYTFEIVVARSTGDFIIVRWDNGSLTIIAEEAVDLQDYGYLLKMSISGSTLKWYRDDMTSPKLSTTDTTYASGYFGVGGVFSGTSRIPIAPHSCVLAAPSSPSSPAKAIVEIECESKDNTVRPGLVQELVEINELTNVPEFLKLEAKRYEILKAKGFTDEEIKALLGYIPQRYVDLASVTWSAFDHKPEHSTMLITITADNPYREGAIQKQVEHAKSKGLKVLNPPKDYREAVEQYRQLKQDFPEWVAGKDNYAYQTLGHEVFDLFQVADTYYGNIVEGYKRDAYKRVPDWEMRRTLNMWINRLKRVNVLTEERDKHVKKLEKVLKVGW